MKHQPFLKPAVIALVTFVHMGLIALAWHRSHPQETVGTDNLTFIDLGSLNGDNQPAAESAAPPPQPSPKQKPQIKPPPEKPRIKAVVRDDVPADIAPPKPKEPIPEPQLQPPKPEPVPQQETKAVSPAPKTDTGHQTDNTTGNTNASGSQTGGQSGATGSGMKGTGNGSNGGGGGSTVDGGYIELPNPPYPPLALENGNEGVVRLSVIVEPNGRVSNVSITRSSRNRLLDKAAENAAKNARYQPKTVDGYPVRTRFNTSFTFKLN